MAHLPKMDELSGDTVTYKYKTRRHKQSNDSIRKQVKTLIINNDNKDIKTIEFETRFNKSSKDSIHIITVKVENESQGSDSFSHTTNLKSEHSEKESVLFIVDGKEISPSEFENTIRSTDVKEMNVLKGDEATKKYGRKGKHGVVEVLLKT